MEQHPKKWDCVLAQFYFTYKDSPNKSTKKSLFWILYGMHPRGICELRDLGKLEKRSIDGEVFAATMSDIHAEIKQKLQDNNHKYKQREYLRGR